MSAAFTPGPWEKIGDSGFTNARIKAPTRRHVAKVYAESTAVDPVCEANANLIAAAPELYEALDAIVCYLLAGDFKSASRIAEGDGLARLARARGDQ